MKSSMFKEARVHSTVIYRVMPKLTLPCEYKGG